jgi:hypothetical protein
MNPASAVSTLAGRLLFLALPSSPPLVAFSSLFHPVLSAPSLRFPFLPSLFCLDSQFTVIQSNRHTASGLQSTRPHKTILQSLAWPLGVLVASPPASPAKANARTFICSIWSILRVQDY